MKAAVIGCGRMGAFTSAGVRDYAPPCWFPLAHAEAIVVHGGLTLAALCDASPANLSRAQAAYGNPAGYADVETLAREVQPALVGIATRTVGRASVIQTLFDHGTRGFHIEKPLCNTAAELNALEQLLLRDDVFATYGAVRRYFHIYRHAVALAHSGRFGPLVEVRANFGEGALYWVQPHAIDLILLAVRGAAVDGVQARLLDVTFGPGPAEIENDPVIGHASIWFEGGVAGHIGRAPGLDLILACRDGEIAVRSDGRRIELLQRESGDPYLRHQSYDEPIPGTGPQGTLAPITMLAACLDQNADAIAANVTQKADILRGQQITFAIAQSHLEGGRIVPLAAADPAMRIWARTGGNPA